MLRRIETPVEFPVPGGTTNSYVVGKPGVLVDPVAGPAELDVDPSEVAHIAVTHTHPDHVGGVQAATEATDATTWALGHHRRRFVRQTGVEPDRTIRDSMEIEATGVHVREFPGHAPDHVAFFHDGAALIGDLARADGSVMVGVPDGDMRAYLTSLRRLRGLGLEVAYPSHGPPIERPTDRFEALISHRLDREKQVLAAVRSGARTPDAIIEVAYDKDLTGLETAAAKTVRAHLRKLDIEGQVSWDGTEAEPR